MKITKAKLKQIILEALEGHFPDYPMGQFEEDPEDFPEDWDHQRYAETDKIDRELNAYAKSIFPDFLNPDQKLNLYADIEDEIMNLAGKVQQGGDIEAAKGKIPMIINAAVPQSGYQRPDTEEDPFYDA